MPHCLLSSQRHPSIPTFEGRRGQASKVGIEGPESRACPRSLESRVLNRGKDTVISFRCRRDDVNCAELAKAFNGGGHAHAAGGKLALAHLAGGYTKIAEDIAVARLSPPALEGRYRGS